MIYIFKKTKYFFLTFFLMMLPFLTLIPKEKTVINEQHEIKKVIEKNDFRKNTLTNITFNQNNSLAFNNEEIQGNSNKEANATTYVFITLGVILVILSIVVTIYYLKMRKNNEYISATIKSNQQQIVEFLEQEDYFDIEYYYYSCNFFNLSYEFKKRDVEKAFFKKRKENLSFETREEMLIIFAYLNSFY